MKADPRLPVSESLDGFVFVRGRRGLTTRGVKQELPLDPGQDLVKRAADAARRTGELVCGALPFDDLTGGLLVVPDERGAELPHIQPPPPEPEPFQVFAHPDLETYVESVRRVLGAIEAGAVDKVVLARTLHVRSARRIDARGVFARLLDNDPDAFVYAARDLRGTLVVGASPELLVRKSGRWVQSEPLAGSLPRSRGAEGARELLDSAKDRREHALVVDAAVEALAPFCSRLEVAPSPSLRSTATMWHLGTDVRGELLDDTTSVVELAAALHPTPAVCGTPRAPAADLINRMEPFDRGLYAGLVGWVDPEGDGEWAVTLRCAELRGDQAVLFAGAGIVAGSDPTSEGAETEAKFRTMLRALGGR